MKHKLRNKKIVYSVIGIISVLLVVSALTYAYWILTKSQEKSNILSAACLDINITG